LKLRLRLWLKRIRLRHKIIWQRRQRNFSLRRSLENPPGALRRVFRFLRELPTKTARCVTLNSLGLCT
jgi:hypothetical protein